MEHPVQFIPDIPVKLGSDQAILGGQHIVILRVTGPGGIKKTDGAFHRIVPSEALKKSMAAQGFGP
jgi:hypothetical protein